MEFSLDQKLFTTPLYSLQNIVYFLYQMSCVCVSFVSSKCVNVYVLVNDGHIGDN